MPVQVPGRGSSNLAAAAAASHKGVTRARQNEKDSSSDSAEAGDEEFNPLNSQSQALLVLPRASSQLTSTTNEPPSVTIDPRDAHNSTKLPETPPHILKSHERYAPTGSVTTTQPQLPCSTLTTPLHILHHSSSHATPLGSHIREPYYLHREAFFFTTIPHLSHAHSHFLFRCAQVQALWLTRLCGLV